MLTSISILPEDQEGSSCRCSHPSWRLDTESGPWPGQRRAHLCAVSACKQLHVTNEGVLQFELVQFPSSNQWEVLSRKRLFSALGNNTVNFLHIFKVDLRLHKLANTGYFLPRRSPVLITNQCSQDRSKCQGYRIPLNSFYEEGEGCGAKSRF